MKVAIPGARCAECNEVKPTGISFVMVNTTVTICDDCLSESMEIISQVFSFPKRISFTVELERG